MKSKKYGLVFSVLILLAGSNINCEDDTQTPVYTPCKVKCPLDKPWVSKVNPDVSACFKTKAECESYGGWDCQQCN
jgi:hypothetical protein